MKMLKKIIAGLTSAVMLATSVISVPVSAETGLYKVVSIPQSDVIKEKNIDKYYKNKLRYDNLYIAYNGNSESVKFSNAVLYQIDSTNFITTGKINPTKINIDSKLKNISPYNFYTDASNSFAAYFSTREYMENGTQYKAIKNFLFVKYDQKKHKLSYIYEDPIGEELYENKAEVRNNNGYYLCSSLSQDLYPDRTVMNINCITIYSPDGKSKSFVFKYNNLTSLYYSTDGVNFYISKVSRKHENGISTNTNIIYKIDENFNKTQIYKKNIGEYGGSLLVLGSKGDIYYLYNNKQLLEYNSKQNTTVILNNNAYINVSFSLNNQYVCLYQDDEVFFYDLYSHRKMDVSKYYPNESDCKMINEDLCYKSGYSQSYIFDLSNNKLVKTYNGTFTEYADNIYLVETDSGKLFINSELNKLDFDDIKGFDNNNVGLVLKNGKAFFVDPDLKQISESFSAKSIDMKGELFIYNDGKKNYFVTYINKDLAKYKNTASATKLAAPKKITAKTEANAVSLSWVNINGASAYRIYIKYPNSNKYVIYSNVTLPRCKINGLESNTKYQFKIAALIKNNGIITEQNKTKGFSIKTSKNTSTDTNTNSIPQTTETDNTTQSTDSIRPEFKKAMDSYEAFFKKYCEFIKKYKKDPTNLSYITDYAEFTKQYADTMQKMEAWEGNLINDAEKKYYLEVTGRISKMLLEVAY